jgi:endonuclease/exonuclease/phosphatase (EEP) superfamily protein YafD
VLIAVELLGLAQALHPLFDALAQFRLHLAIALGLAALLMAVTRSYRMASLAALTGLAGTLALGPALHLPGRTAEAAVFEMRLLQFNSFAGNWRPEAILPQIAANQPDVITLQEISGRTGRLLDDLAPRYAQQVVCASGGVGAVAVLTRWPVVEKGCEVGYGLAWVRTNIGGREVTVASLHLRWPFPFGQAQQIDRLEPVLRRLPQPVIVAGDFNAAPWSHGVARIAAASGGQVAGGLRFSLWLAPRAYGPFPILPIDHVVLPEGSEAADVRLGAPAGSDHLPVLARFRLPKEF